MDYSHLLASLNSSNVKKTNYNLYQTLKNAIQVLNNTQKTAEETQTVYDTISQSIPIFTYGNLIGVQVFTTAGTYTYTPTTGTTAVIIQLQGAGGGSAGCTANPGGLLATLGQAGGSGAWLQVTLTSKFSGGTLVVGAKGTGGSAGANNGTAGGDSKFTTTDAVVYTAGGGAGGVTQAAIGAVFANVAIGQNLPAGGVASGGDININGESTLITGLVELVGPTISGWNSYGSRSVMGLANCPGGLLAGAQSLAGSNATGYGAGASGSAGCNFSLAVAGGNGSVGCAVIYEYKKP